MNTNERMEHDWKNTLTPDDIMKQHLRKCLITLRKLAFQNTPQHIKHNSIPWGGEGKERDIHTDRKTDRERQGWRHRERLADKQIVHQIYHSTHMPTHHSYSGTRDESHLLSDHCFFIFLFFPFSFNFYFISKNSISVYVKQKLS